MATILLSAAGAAIGGSIGGTVLGLSMAAVGRFAGAMIGRSIDQRVLGQGSDVVETGRVSRLRLTGTGEGDAIARVHGRMRVAGNVIWATEFRETKAVSGGSGKGGPPTPTRVSYSYSVSLAIVLCEGEIGSVGRVWADGVELARDALTMRVYPGSRDQLPDPKIEAVEGAGTVPAYRGTAYVVIEDLDLTEYGNRVPQFTFEVLRPAPVALPGAELDPAHAVRGVAMLPGSGEYVLSDSDVKTGVNFLDAGLANVSTPAVKADFTVALENLQAELPACRAVSLVVSWFGDDLRCGDCTVRPKVERRTVDGLSRPWQVAGLTRSSAELVAQDAEGEPVYGGTPTDQSVIEAIGAMKEAGQDVMYYPFILMDQVAGNGLPDPYSDAGSQPVLPWRGRITGSVAPGRDGSPDGTAAAEAEVDAFFGTASAADFALAPEPEVEEGYSEGGENMSYGPLEYTGPVVNSPVEYTGPEEWGYRRFILHQAMLCLKAGGVESFCIGSEMRGLTTIRGENNSFPAVAHLVALAAEVRAILGPEVKISYAADWSEYFGYAPGDGSGDRFFHLDPLWADDNIDFIGIDNYMPLSDWRDGEDHADAGAGAIYDIDYLMGNVAGGEGYDWYYHSETARDAQIRTPITDGAHGEPWVWRYKDIRSWWENVHHERVGGVRAELPTAWVPGSKPVRFTEYGCAAIDKGTNQPNKFLDPKSSESAVPHYSNGQQDELIQFQYLRAMAGYWGDPAHNPVSEEYGGPMVDMEHAYAWAWDARPYPFFPNDVERWSDGENYLRGHWITGRVSAWRLASVVEEVCGRAGLDACDTGGLHGHVRGYLVEQVAEPRAALQPLALRYGFDAVERGGALVFRPRDGLADHVVDVDRVVRDDERDGAIEEVRGSDVELAGRVRLRFIEAGADYDVISEEAVLGVDDASVSTSEIPLAMTRAEGRQTVERWLSESRVATDTVRLTLPRSRLAVGAGDVIALPEEGGQGHFRVDRVEMLAHAQKLEAIRIEPASYRPVLVEPELGPLRGFDAPAPVTPFFLDLPLMTGEEVPQAPHVAVTARPWPGSAAVYVAEGGEDFSLDQILEARTPIGVTENALAPAPSGVFDRGAALRVRMRHGGLQSVTGERVLSGANLCAIGDGSPGGWELFQFRDAALVDVDTYEIGHRLRGQLGTEVEAIWPAGSYIVRLDGTPKQIGLTEGQIGQERHYRVGPASRPVDDPSYVHTVLAFEGAGLRPLSPVHLAVNGAPGEDMAFGWVRRTRIGGDRWETPEVPLGEEAERYVVRVVQGEAVLREEMVIAPVWTYTAAAQGADGLAGAFEVRVAQVSALVGAGRFAALGLVA
ncbi:baseplate multidomain protein megatron [Roseovarius indicus]|uniref:baseplate multidomain protein megatron n=3 Tax=Roseovarius indicus TaxID=540747 RepID=UPI0007D90CC0|nr:glycoside hydrolase/phage tail family protein [Roseovarius indicus]OAO09093.1 host specificity protein [Roseovarius indicus]